MKSFMKHAHRESDSMGVDSGGSTGSRTMPIRWCAAQLPPHLPWLNECYYNYSIQP